LYQTYQPKHILNTHKHCDGWFWNRYSVSPYAGCEYGCEYCYARDEKYNPHKPERDPEVVKFDDAFSEYIKVKENAPELLRRELKRRPPDLVYFTGYQPANTRYGLARQTLKLLFEYGFPVFINEKSPAVLDDLDLLKRISEESYLNVAWSIITARDDATRRVFEPRAPSVKERFAAMRRLADNGILTGTLLMPILPFVYDSEESIAEVCRATRDCGGQYVLDGGLTLWRNCKPHYYRVLERYDSTLMPRYERLYGSGQLSAEHGRRNHELVRRHAEKCGLTAYIPRPVRIYPQAQQLNRRVAAQFYLDAREMMMTGQTGYRYWAYLKAAWLLDDLKQDGTEIFREQGARGLQALPGIGKSLAQRIEWILTEQEKR